MSGKECKELALKILNGKLLIAFVVILIYMAIVTALSYVTGGIGTFLLSSILVIGMYNVFINGYLGKGYEVKDMFDGMDKALTNRICLSVLKNLYITLWTLLFIIPGIVKSYSYFLAEFISRDNPDKTATECINESRKLMDGHKADLFMFQLSFIGWIILGMFTCGILYIWLLPYMYQSLIIYIDKNIYKLSANKTENEENIEENIFDQSNEEVIDVEATEEVKDYKYCTNCGTKIPKDSIYCGNCGTKVNKEK